MVNERHIAPPVAASSFSAIKSNIQLNLYLSVDMRSVRGKTQGILLEVKGNLTAVMFQWLSERYLGFIREGGPGGGNSMGKGPEVGR